MKNTSKLIKDIPHEEVREKFLSYPDKIKPKLLYLRQLILDTAEEMDWPHPLEETLKWGEPSYLVKGGSTVRIDWKKNSPQHYAMYFNCKTKLIDAFKKLYAKKFKFSGNRAIVFEVSQDIPVKELKHCIELALSYHQVKHQALFGI